MVAAKAPYVPSALPQVPIRTSGTTPCAAAKPAALGAEHAHGVRFVEDEGGAVTRA